MRAVVFIPLKPHERFALGATIDVPPDTLLWLGEGHDRRHVGYVESAEPSEDRLGIRVVVEFLPGVGDLTGASLGELSIDPL